MLHGSQFLRTRSQNSITSNYSEVLSFLLSPSALRQLDVQLVFAQKLEDQSKMFQVLLQ